MKIKKISKILAMLCTFALLCGCTNSEAPESSDTSSSSTSSTDSENSSTNSTSSIDSSSSTVSSSSDSDSSAGYQEPEHSDHFTAPDGSIVYFSDADEYDGYGFYKYDHSYIRYAKPIFHNTFDEPDLINWDTLEFKTNYVAPIENLDYFKVKAGDKLQNGLTVKSAEIRVHEIGMIENTKIELSGELTLDGYLYRAPEDDYMVTADDLRFFPDPTKYDSIPKCPSSASESVYEWVYMDAEFAMVGDLTEFCVGNLNDISVDLSCIIRRGEFVKAKIKIKDVILYYHNAGGGLILSATLVSVE